MTDRIPVREVLQRKACSSQCLLALEPEGRCMCVCGGMYHGALIDADVAATETITDADARYLARQQWWIECDRGGWPEHLRDETSTVVKTDSTYAFNRAYRSMNRERGYFLATLRGGRRWRVQWDAPHHDATLWPDPYSTEAARQFVHALVQTGRAQSATFAKAGERPEWGEISGLRGLDEARTAEVLVGEAMVGNPCGTVRALYVLLGQGDPVKDGYDPSSMPLVAQ